MCWKKTTDKKNQKKSLNKYDNLLNCFLTLMTNDCRKREIGSSEKENIPCYVECLNINIANEQGV